MQYVSLAARCAVGLVFLVAVLGKVRSRKAFAEFRSSVPGLAPGLPRTTTSVAVVTAESVTVVLLAIEPTAPVGFVLAGAVLLAFTWAIQRSLRNGRRASCRCLGTSTVPLGRVHVVRNLALISAVTSGLSAHLAAASAPVHPAGALVAAAGGGVLAVVFIFFHELADVLIAPSPGGPR
ncbi:hypothetical protein OHR68_05985 [Spirillospora sp. NBC_00431]